MNLSRKQKLSQILSVTERAGLLLPRGRSIGAGWTGSLGLVDANYYLRMHKQQGPTV